MFWRREIVTLSEFCIDFSSCPLVFITCNIALFFKRRILPGDLLRY
jgi:hypothetical protein